MTRDLDAIPDVLVDEEEEELSRSVMMATSFSGPLPPPQILQQYDEVVPGAAERIIANAESRQAHDQAMEERALTASREVVLEKEKTFRWWIALPSTVVAIVLIAAFVAVSQMDTTWESYGLGGFIAVLTLTVSVYRLFFHGRKNGNG